MNPAANPVLNPSDSPSLQQQLGDAHRLGRRGALMLGLGVLPLLAWVAWAPLASAVVAHGHVKIDLDRVVVQHAEGGTVREVKVRDGQRVAQGAPLVVLGDVGVDADANRLTHRLGAERAGAIRLEAEQAGRPQIGFPSDLRAAAAEDSRLAEQLAKEEALFTARRDSLNNQTALLREQRQKITQEIVHLRGQVEQTAESLRHQLAELERNRQLVKEGFVSDTRISQLEGALADYRVRQEERRSDLARAEQRLVETDLRLAAMHNEYRQRASDGLKEANLRISEIEQELRKFRDASQRQVITAPTAGVVMNLRFPNPGGVLSPREPVADIVPDNPRLVVEAQLRPEDIDRVRLQQPARIRFSAFNPRTTPMVEGRVVYVSADRIVDRQNPQLSYYLAQVEADAASLQAAGGLRLQAGMPGEVYIDGRERTALQYLLEPLSETFQRAGRER